MNVDIGYNGYGSLLNAGKACYDHLSPLLDNISFNIPFLTPL